LRTRPRADEQARERRVADGSQVHARHPRIIGDHGNVRPRAAAGILAP